MINIFFDTEFTGLQQNTSLISLALVAEDGRALYIESNNFDRTLVDDWIAQNVIDSLFILQPKHFEDSSVKFGYADGYLYNPLQWNDGAIVYTKDDYSVKDAIVSWLSLYEQVQIISDCSSYDWVLFCEIFGGALNLPEHISPYCHDINQDIARYIGKNDRNAFDYSREKLAFASDEEAIALAKERFATSNESGRFIEVGDVDSFIPTEGQLANYKHNALWDAQIIKLCHDKIKSVN